MPAGDRFSSSRFIWPLFSFLRAQSSPGGPPDNPVDIRAIHIMELHLEFPAGPAWQGFCADVKKHTDSQEIFKKGLARHSLTSMQ